MAHPLIENLLGPTRPKKSSMREAKKNVPLPKRKQGICVEDNDETIGNVLQAVSNS